jgi:hypothetical protein
MEPKEKAEEKELTRNKEQRVHGHTEDPEKKPIIAAVSDPTDLRIEELSVVLCKERKQLTMWNDNGFPLPIKTAGKIPNAEADQDCLSETNPLTKSDKPISDDKVSSPPPGTKSERMPGDEKVR